MKALTLTTVASLAMLSACANDSPDVDVQQDEPEATLSGDYAPVTVPLINNEKEEIGVVMVARDPAGGVRLRVEATSIPPGEHGMHLHVKGDCSASDFTSAGGHINPEGKQHGLKNPDGPDNADMENAVADVDSIVSLERHNPRVSLRGDGGLPALLDADGSALIIHANPDDQVTQPIGGAGPRIACAEIKR